MFRSKGYSTAQLSSLYYETSPSGLTGTLSKGERFIFKAGDVVSFYISETNRFLVAKSPTLPMSFTDLNTQNTDIEKPVLTAYYIDAPVKGLIYENSFSGLKGVTDELGRFRFFDGDEVRYYLDPVNRIYLGKVKPVDGQTIFISPGVEVDPMVDPTVLPFVFFIFDTAAQGASYMDFTNIVFSQSTVEKIKLALRKELVDDVIQDQWIGLKKLQAEVTGYIFKFAGAAVNENNYVNNISNSVNSLTSIKVEKNDFEGVYVFGVPRAKSFISFESSGVLRALGDGETFATGTYEISGEKVVYRFNDNSPNTCDKSFELKKRQPRWSLVLFGMLQTPVGCDGFNAQREVLMKSKIDSSTTVAKLAGKKLTLPVNGVCSFGIGNISFAIDASNTSPDIRNFTMSPSICTNNMTVSGVVRNTVLPGVLVFELNNNIPNAKVFFSISEDGKSAFTTTSIQRALPDSGFDGVYGAESVFTLN